MATPHRIALTLEQCWHRVPGGTASSALQSIRALAAHSDLDLIGVSAWHRHAPEPGWRPTIPVKALPFPRPLLYESWHRLRRPSVDHATGVVDLIHVTGMAMPPKSAPMVVTVHDLAFMDEPEHFTPRGVRFFHRAIELARDDADIIVCPSQATIDDCLAHGFAADRLRLVPWGVEVKPASADEIARVKDRYGLSRPYLLWTGTIEPRKNLAVLLEAFGRLKDHDVELVLAGPEGWNDELARLELRLTGAGMPVRRLGFVPSCELAALYAGAAVFCFPSTREGFGLPVLEAMAQGTPVVTSATTSTAEVVTDGGSGSLAGVLVDPSDAVALADAVAGLLDDPERARALGEAARRRAATFTWARTAEALTAAYGEAAG
jgi:glycosyltransferase involved in cell wall biosynthesis